MGLKIDWEKGELGSEMAQESAWILFGIDLKSFG